MSKFLELCEKVESLLKENQQDGTVAPADPSQQAAATAQAGLGDPAAGDQPPKVATNADPTHVLTNPQIEELVKTLSSYLQKNLGEDDALSKALKTLEDEGIDDSDDSAKKIYDKIIAIVNPEKAQANPEVAVPEAETINA
jgi:hypothetical protein